MADAHKDALANTVAVTAPAADDDPRVGQVIAGRYRLIARIGRGGMGAVYAAEHLSTGKRFAVKTLLPGFGRIGEIARRFEREAKAASLLRHENVIDVTDFGELPDGALFLVMELVRGRALGDLLDEGPLGPARTITIARQVLSALAHAHRHGVIHRDLKPDNVMVLDAGETEEERDLVKLLDFGIAKVVGEAEAEVGGEKLTQAGVAFGTPDYMAPEQALGETVDARADLYSMGVILFEMLAGRKPFVSDDKMAVLRMHVALDPPSLAEAAGRPFPPSAEALVARALAKRRHERFASAEEMLAALEAAAPELAPHAVGYAPAALATGTPAPTLEPPAPAFASAAPVGAATPPVAPVPTAPSVAPAPPAAVSAAPTVGLPAPSLAELRRSRPFFVRLAILGLPIVTLLVVLVVLLAGGFSGKKPAPPAGALPAMVRQPPPRSELALRAEKLLAAGDAEDVVALLEVELGSGAGLKDPWAHLVLGHARFTLGRDREAVVAYERALVLEPLLAHDATLLVNARELLGRKDRTAALGAVDLLARLGAPARDLLADAASRHKVREVRQRARAVAERDGFLDRVDRVESYSLDLHQGGSCRERQQAIGPLRALKDKRAIPALKRAIGRSGGLLGLENVNSCLDREAREAVQFLEALP